MKIFIAGSMSFAGKIIETKKILAEMGFESDYAPDTHLCHESPHLKLNEDLEHCENMDIQEKCDAILLLNYPKDGVNGYIGSNCLIELGLAYYIRQKIFLLYPPPPPQIARYHVEVMHMKPVILHGDIKEIKKHL